MHPPNEITTVAGAIRSASALTESTFVSLGLALETSIDILASLAERFEAVLTNLKGESLDLALKALSRTAARLADPAHAGSGGSAGFSRLLALSDAVVNRIAQMTDSLGDVDILAINAKIAAANIRLPGTDFSTFADEIGRTLAVARTSLTSFGAELRTVREHLAAAHAGQLEFERHQKDAASSITDRLMATVEAITRRHQRAARATTAVRLRSARVRQRIGNAVMALQIGDTTRQRLEHMDFALSLVGTPVDGGGDYKVLDGGEQRTLAILVHRLQSAQCRDAARAFDRDLTSITETLSSLAEEARALWTLGGSAFGVSEEGGSGVIAALEGQVGEALDLFERFEAARSEVAGITTTVSEATARLRAHLQSVQSLESDIRIMGLNTTFKCARIGREGLALSLIAQELRVYASGFAKEAEALVGEVETISSMTAALTGGNGADETNLIAEGMREIRASMSTLRSVGGVLDDALGELEGGSGRVVGLLEDTAVDLAERDDIGSALRDAAATLDQTVPYGSVKLDALTEPTEQMLALMAHGYTMASERAIHAKILGRAVAAEPEAETDLLVEDALF